MNLHPFDEVAANAEKMIGEGWTVYQQFNCADCGAKQTMDDKNVFHLKGRCEECGHITDIKKDGCNFMAVSGGKL
jgi:DNA-directed RNA polymerase subunit RPC12/RpoP